MCIYGSSKMYGKTTIVNIDSTEPLFYPPSVTVNKCNSSCNEIDNPS